MADKGKRRYISQTEKDHLLRASLSLIAEEDGQVTLRHLFYRLVGLELIEKTEAAYKSLGRYTRDWRHSGAMPYSALADNTRWYYGAIRFSSPEEAVANALKNYRSDLWDDWNAHIEIWTEKDAMVAILLSAADPLGVKVFSTRGYASIGSVANTAAPTISEQLEQEKEVYIYYFGDHDPSGTDITRAAKLAIERQLTSDQKLHFHFERAAILPEDIESYNLPTRLTKKSDPRSANFKGESVELDAMDMRVVKQRVRDCILDGTSQEDLLEALEKEKRDKDRIEHLVWGLNSGERLALGPGDGEDGDEWV